MNSFLLILLLSFGMLTGYSQTATITPWKYISSPKDDLVFSLPPEFLVFKDGKRYSLFGFEDGVRIDVVLDLSGDPKGQLRSSLQWPWQPDTKSTDFEKDNFVGYIYITQNAKSSSTTVLMASPKIFYRFTLSSASKPSAAFDKFLFSIMINGKPLYRQDRPTVPEAESIISAASLETSPEVNAALKVKDAKSSKIKYDLNRDKAPDGGELESPAVNAANGGNADPKATEYSRRVIFLRKPQPADRFGARNFKISGTVNLRVVFKADNSVGEITVVKDLSGGLVERAVAAARSIKFLAATKNGKPVDTEMTVQYTF